MRNCVRKILILNLSDPALRLGSVFCFYITWSKIIPEKEWVNIMKTLITKAAVYLHIVAQTAV